MYYPLLVTQRDHTVKSDKAIAKDRKKTVKEKDQNRVGGMMIEYYDMQRNGLPVGSTPRLESATDGCYANWCQINGHAALDQFRAQPSFPTALPQPCPPILGHVWQPAPLPALEPDPA